MLDWFLEMVTSRYFLAPFAGWFFAQALKIPFSAITTKKVDFHKFFSPGGMPSSHTAMMVALTLMLAYAKGTGSPEFAISMAFSAIVMYDAAGVRRETGRQGKMLNEIIGSFIMEGRPISDEEMKEIVGHTPFEVFIGAIVGILCAAFLIFVFRV